jgi:hypothetical protein
MLPQFLIKDAQQNPLRLVVIQQSAASINGKSDKMCVEFVVDDLASIRHREKLRCKNILRMASVLEPIWLGHKRNIEHAPPGLC